MDERHHVTLGSHRMAYTVRGEGAPVLAIHSSGLSVRQFKRLEAAILAILDSDAKIPGVEKIGGYYYNFWKDKQHERGLTIVGVHTPEFPFEKSARNVRAAIGQNGLQFDEWLDPAALRGREAILVVDGREKDVCGGREALCRPLEPLAPETVLRGADKVTTFSLWRCGIPADAALPLPYWRAAATAPAR